MASAKTIDQVIRITSTAGKLYLALKDGKKHTITELKRVTGYTGYRGFWGTAYRLGRVLRTQFGKQIVITERHEKSGTLQMVAYVKKGAAKPAAKKTTAKSKPVAKKVAPKAKPVVKEEVAA